MHDVMKITNDSSHMAHTISKYFEINQSKNCVLHLIKPETKKKEMKPEEKVLVKIRGAKENTRFKVEDKRNPHQKKIDMDNDNRDLMFNKYPDLKDELIRDTAQFEKEATHNFENPDMNFCQLIISLSMFLISVYVFYTYRDLNSEYYNR